MGDMAAKGTGMTKLIHEMILHGNINEMTPEQQVQYAIKVAESVGIDPTTAPFQVIDLPGRGRVLYATKGAAEQLRRVHGVSIVEMTRDNIGSALIVQVKGRDKSGREDIATGSVNLEGLQGERLANAILRCETKAKRRLTLSIVGLGMLDETEVQDIPGAKPVQQDNDQHELDEHFEAGKRYLLQAVKDNVLTEDEYKKTIDKMMEIRSPAAMAAYVNRARTRLEAKQLKVEDAEIY